MDTMFLWSSTHSPNRTSTAFPHALSFLTSSQWHPQKMLSQMSVFLPTLAFRSPITIRVSLLPTFSTAFCISAYKTGLCPHSYRCLLEHKLAPTCNTLATFTFTTTILSLTHFQLFTHLPFPLKGPQLRPLFPAFAHVPLSLLGLGLGWSSMSLAPLFFHFISLTPRIQILYFLMSLIDSRSFSFINCTFQPPIMSVYIYLAVHYLCN